MNKLIKKLVIRTLILIFITVVLTQASSAVGTIINNNLALEQMQHDDTSFVIKELYNNIIKPCVAVSCSIIFGVGVGVSIYDVIKFYKKKENNT